MRGRCDVVIPYQSATLNFEFLHVVLHLFVLFILVAEKKNLRAESSTSESSLPARKKERERESESERERERERAIKVAIFQQSLIILYFL